jgi:hypothetical protein
MHAMHYLRAGQLVFPVAWFRAADRSGQFR